MKTLKNLFKPEDFEHIGYVIGRVYDYDGPDKAAQQVIKNQIIEMAQKAVDKFIEENSVKVYGYVTGSKLGDWSSPWTMRNVESQGHTHQGILIDIQEIPKKQCEHKEAIYYEAADKTWFKCRDCGKPVKAKGWEIV